MLVSSVQAVVACYVTAPRVCILCIQTTSLDDVDGTDTFAGLHIETLCTPSIKVVGTNILIHNSQFKFRLHTEQNILYFKVYILRCK